MYIVSCNCSLAGTESCKSCSGNIEDFFKGTLTTSTFNLNEDWWKSYIDTRKSTKLRGLSKNLRKLRGV